MYNYREKLLKALKENAPHIETITILYELLMDGVTQNRLSSMWSPFGFSIMCLNPPTSTDIVRLHIWLSNFRPKQVPDWPIHFHSWTLHSKILCGSITNHIYNVQPNCDRDRELYQAQYINTNSSSVEATGIRVSCELINSETYYPGQSYFVKPGQYHSVDAGENMLCATLVLMTDNNNDVPCIVGEINHKKNYVYEREMLDDEKTLKIIGELTSKLSHMYF
ncbi:hypothetical protein F7734_57435 [Scytonema sp. UIC 10036]|uniref:hypothetical protein n=1 Tax=Scytonema sp. UIC 10036 TaxID=2304196 RepID=UPI0012DA471C|nr:hypothetical protein [Scytonema sp. UIC 10036]MUH01353.1 hypothetical protein [Scytonema sp. UIC 10036]